MMLCGAALLAATLAACAQPTQVTLVAGAARDCTGETRSGIEFMKDAPGAPPPPQTMAMTQSFTSSRVPEGYLFEQGGTTPMGEITLQATVSQAGEVRSAQFSGGLFAQDPTASSTFAMTAARAIPELLVMGRTLKQGDQLYSPEFTQLLVDAMRTSMGMPPTAQLAIETNIPFTGATEVGGRRVLNFAGSMTANGSDSQNGQQAVMAMPSEVAMSFDAATGLMLSQSTNGLMNLTVDGERQMAMRVQQSMTCTIRAS
jgi:hypothetical protein